MKQLFLYSSLGILSLFMGKCSKEKSIKTILPKENKELKNIDKDLATIGILIFDGVIMNEVVAPLDVFSNTDKNGKALFNTLLIGKDYKTYTSAHGLKFIPDNTIEDAPELKVLVVPSSYSPEKQTSDVELVNFIKEQNKTTAYIASHCAGAFLIGEAGIAKDKKIVTYVTGGKVLQQQYPDLKVADDTKESVVKDGKFISSNGSLISYTASLDLLEELTTKVHRAYVEEAILLNRLKSN